MINNLIDFDIDFCSCITLQLIDFPLRMVRDFFFILWRFFSKVINLITLITNVQIIVIVKSEVLGSFQRVRRGRHVYRVELWRMYIRWRRGLHCVSMLLVLFVEASFHNVEIYFINHSSRRLRLSERGSINVPQSVILIFDLILILIVDLLERLTNLILWLINCAILFLGVI